MHNKMEYHIFCEANITYILILILIDCEYLSIYFYMK